MSSSTQVRQTSGSSIHNVPKTVMVFHRSTRHLHLHLPTLASRSKLPMAVGRPVGTLLRMSFKWPVSRCRISLLVSSQRLSCRLFGDPTSGLCDQLSDGLLIQPVSGLMGLAWQALSSSGATPFWQALYQNNVLDEPLMAFYLTRYQNVTGAKAQEPGGVFTLGLSKVPLHRLSKLITPP